MSPAHPVTRVWRSGDIVSRRPGPESGAGRGRRRAPDRWV